MGIPIAVRKSMPDAWFGAVARLFTLMEALGR
jgi:hypothetical protein